MAALELDTRLTRTELAEFLPNLRAVKAFEGLVADVATTIPTAINATAQRVDEMDDGAVITNAAIAAVRALATAVQQSVAALQDAAATRRSDHATIHALQMRVEALESLFLTRRR